MTEGYDENSAGGGGFVGPPVEQYAQPLPEHRQVAPPQYAVPDGFGGAEGPQGMNLPDQVMNDPGSAMLRLLIDSDDAPAKFKRKFHWVFSKDNILTFLDEPRKRQKLLMFDIIKLHSLHEIPYYDYTFETEQDWAVARMMLETKLDRAMGFDKGNRINERIVEQAQFQEQRQIMNNESEGINRPGMWGKLANFVMRR
jgi:hypothetical protein